MVKMISDDCDEHCFVDMVNPFDWANWMEDVSLSHVEIDEKSNAYIELEPHTVLTTFDIPDWEKHNAIIDVDFSQSDSSTVTLPDEAAIGILQDVHVPLRINDPALMNQTTNTSSENSNNQDIEQTVEISKNEVESCSGTIGTKDSNGREYVKKFTDQDVLLGRGRISNKHIGNKKFHDEVRNLSRWYQTSKSNEKAQLSKCLVNYVHSYGGRFLKMDDSKNQWFIVTNQSACRKASGSLR